MSRIVIPGGSGFLGQALTARLVGRGDEVVILGRGESQHVEGARTVAWDAESIGPWASELDGADAALTLAQSNESSRSNLHDRPNTLCMIVPVLASRSSRHWTVVDIPRVTSRARAGGV